MSWTDKVGDIVLINMDRAIDRYIVCLEQFSKFNIPFRRVEAVDNAAYPAIGLRDTVVNIFKEVQDRNLKSVLIFEDDFDIIDEQFNEVMEDVMKQLPEDFDMLYLGGQCTEGFKNPFYSHNILPVRKCYATHAVIYGRKVIDKILQCYFDAPIDNWLVSHIQPTSNVFITYPMLVSQRAGYSFIGKNDISWKPFLEIKYQQKINEMSAQGLFNRPPKPY